MSIDGQPGTNSAANRVGDAYQCFDQHECGRQGKLAPNITSNKAKKTQKPLRSVESCLNASHL